ncbi:MAG: Na+/H+ antiporter NhaC family protein [Pirellulales bacterium]
MVEHPYGWLSIAPPVVAIVLAIATRRVLFALFAGLAVGSLILTGGNPIAATVDLLENQLWQSTIQPDKLRVYAFSMTLSAMIGVIQIGGGMRGMVELLTPWARSRASGQIVVYLTGLLVFFDDYANCLLIGGTMRPTCDRLRISREKLSFLVDATAAPVAGLAIVSTFIAIELEYIREGITNLPPAIAAGLNPFELFLACIPYRFYVIQMLLFLPLIAFMKRDFGPMLAAERRAAAGETPAWATSDFAVDPYDDGQGVRTSHWSNAIVPLAVTLSMTLWLIYATGAAKIAQSSPDLAGFARFRASFGSGDSSLALYYGGLAGLFVAVVLARWRERLPGKRIAWAAGTGAKMVLPALLILLLAGAMSRMTGNKSTSGAPTTQAFEHQHERLYTGDFLKGVLISVSENTEHDITVWLPTVVFVLACTIAFCTGTSYGTMGILVPMVIPLATALTEVSTAQELAANPIFLCAMGSVLAGAIFGDHCSPISDTTILSALASGCDHMAHVNTQLPYAFAVGGVAILFGTLPIGFGISVWLLLALQLIVLAGLLLLVGKRVES